MNIVVINGSPKGPNSISLQTILYLEKLFPVAVDSFPAMKGARLRLEMVPGRELLIVDDNRMNRVVLQALLKETEVSVDQADSGAQALELCKEKRYDLILMDYMMQHGEETLVEIYIRMIHHMDALICRMIK